MANVGSAAAGKTLIGNGNGASPTYASIGTNSGLSVHGVLLAQGNGPFSTTNPGVAGTLLVSNGLLADPTFQSGGSVFGQTLTGDTGGARSPTAGNWNIIGGTVAAGTSPVKTAGAASTLTVNVQKSQSIAATDATKIGLAAFDSASFGVDANGFVTLNSPATLYPWIDQGSSTAILSNKNYFATGAVTLTLPAAPAQGDKIGIIVDTASSVVLQANTGQTIRLGSAVSTVAGTMTNGARGDAVTLIYRTTGAVWIAQSFEGTWSPA